MLGLDASGRLGGGGGGCGLRFEGYTLSSCAWDDPLDA